MPLTPTDIAPTDFAEVAALLGRAPRGLEAIAATTDTGSPAVLRVASLVDDRPFPTLFWLVDPALCYRIDQLEAGGLIAELQARVYVDDTLRRRLADDHGAHIRLREQFLSESQRSRLEALGFAGTLARGIGGIANFDRIRCLHCWYGAHLVQPNAIGELLDARWKSGAADAVPVTGRCV